MNQVGLQIKKRMVEKHKLNEIQKLIREEVNQILREEGDKLAPINPATKVEPDKHSTTPIEKPQPKPKQASSSEQPKSDQPDTAAVLLELVDDLIHKIRHSVGTPSTSDLTAMLVSLIQAWGMTSEDKLLVLRDIRNITIK